MKTIKLDEINLFFMQKPFLLGIRIEYTRLGDRLTADFFIGKGSSRSETFVTSPHIRTLIEEAIQERWNPSLQILGIGGKIGHIAIDFDKKTRIGTWKEYFPYQLDQGTFARSGLADQLEERFIKKMKKTFPQLKKLLHIGPSFSRIKQLEKRGFNNSVLTSGYSFRRAKRRLRAKISRDKKKAAMRRR